MFRKQFPRVQDAWILAHARFAQPKTGLGTGVVKALAKQLDANVVTLRGASGTKVSITHATFAGA
jgi:two-component sensor histidine kinase